MSSDDWWPVAPIMCKLCRTKSEIPAVLLVKVHVFRRHFINLSFYFISNQKEYNL